MRILQIVTYISPDGAYGGPVRVAINQAKALRELGHEVVVAAAAGGFGGSLPKEYDGFPVQLFPCWRMLPNAGFAGITSPGLIVWLMQAVRGADVVHVHLARDLVTLPAAAITLMLDKPLVVQTHGMIDPTEKRLAKPLDKFLTRPVLRKSSSCLYLTDDEQDDLRNVARGDLNFNHLRNGVIFPRALEAGDNVNVQNSVEVLFLARLHKIKRPLVFVEAAQKLSDSGSRAKFSLAGPDEGEAEAVQQMIKAAGPAARVVYEGAVSPEQTASRLARCDVYVLPSLDETFPMSVIEALSLGKPVIITKSCGLASFIDDAGAGIVIDGSVAEMARAIKQLVDDPAMREKMGKRAKTLAREEFAISSVASKLDHIYSVVS